MLRDNIRSINLSVNDEGIVQCYDVNRTKILSINRESLSFGIDHSNISGKRWLKLVGGVKSNLNSYKIPRNATITSITVQTKNNADDARFNIRINGSSSNLHTTTLNSTNETIENVLNYDINKGDYLQMFLWVVSGNVDFPVVSVEIAWR